VLASPPPKLDFVLPGLVAGHVGAIVAPGSTGKSFLELQVGIGIAAAVPIAEGAFPTPTEPRRVVLLAGEDDSPVLAQRIHAIVDRLTCQSTYDGPLFPTVDRATLALRLAENLCIYPLQGVAMRLPTAAGAPSLFEQLRATCTGARLLVIDPLRRFHDGDENDSAAMTSVVQACERLASGSAMAVVVAHHTNKASALNGMADQQQAVRGSSALTDAIRWQANLIRMTTKEADELGIEAEERGYFVRLELAKANYVPPQATIWLRRMPGGVLAHVPLGTTRTPQRKGGCHAR
jgi:RecA-family ATPase